MGLEMDAHAGKMLKNKKKISNTIRLLGSRFELYQHTGKHPVKKVGYLGLELLNSKNTDMVKLLDNYKGKDGPGQGLSWERTLRLMIQVFRGIYDCHFIGILHRDIKMENIGILPEPNGHIPVLIDFGMARIYTDKEGEILKPRS